MCTGARTPGLHLRRLASVRRTSRDDLRSQRLQGRAGFTITELLISVIIVSIGVVGFASAVGLASTELWFGRRDSEVSLLVADQLEQLKAMGHDAVQPGDRVEGSYRLQWNVLGSNPKKVLLVAEYPGSNGSTLRDTLVTYVPR
jgi:prepilin-type N-terminal cleavage/methylation domain-containing protein